MTERELITMDRKYKNSTGDVRVLCVDGPGEYPVVGIDGCGDTCRWTADGRTECYEHNRFYDLTHTPETRTVWVNVYRGITAEVHTCETDARYFARRDAIAIAQPLTFEVNK